MSCASSLAATRTRRQARGSAISPHTVASHIKKAYRKLGVNSAGAAVMRAVQLGFIQP